MRIWARLLVVAFALTVDTAVAQDPRVEQAFELIDQQNWDAAQGLAEDALADAQDDEDRFEARVALATINYYLDESDAPLAELSALNDDAISLFGVASDRRLPVLEMLGNMQQSLGDLTSAARTLTQVVRIAQVSETDPETLQFAQLNLSWTYLEAGKFETSAIIASQLSAAVAFEYGEDDEIALEAGLVRAFAHLGMGHPVEALVHAQPAFLVDQEQLAAQIPLVFDLLSDFSNDVDRYAEDNNPHPQQSPKLAVDVWVGQAAAVSAQRARGAEDLSALEDFQQAVMARDTPHADTIARRLTERVLSDDPTTAQVYEIMLTAHLLNENPSGALVWAQRLLAMPTGYLATLAGDTTALFIDLAELLGGQERFDDALALINQGTLIADLRDGANATSVQMLRIGQIETLLFAGMLPDAEAEIERSLASNQANVTPAPALRAQMLTLYGELFALRKNMPEAQAYFGAAAQLLDQSGQTTDIRWARLLYAWAQVQSQLGQHEKAENLMRRSLALRIKLDGPLTPATQIGQIGLASVLANAGNFDSAFQIVEIARAEIESNTDQNASFRVPLMQVHADLLAKIGETGRSDELYAVATAVVQGWSTSGDAPAHTAGAYTSLAWDAWADDRLDDAERFAGLALAGLNADAPEQSAITALQGRIALERGQDTKALALFRTVTAVINSPARRDFLQSRDHFPLHIEAALRRASGTTGVQSVEFMAEAFAVAQQVNFLNAGSALSQASARWETAPALAVKVRQMQDTQAEIQQLTEAFSGSLADAGDSSGIRTRLNTANENYAMVKSQITTDFPKYSAVASPGPVDLDQVSAMLAPDEILLLFATSDEDVTAGAQGSTIFAVTNDFVQTAATVSRAELANIARALRCEAALPDPLCAGTSAGTRGAFSLEVAPEQAAKNRGPDFDTTLAHRAYQLVLGPVATLFAGKSKLIVVPDQALIALPFHLLVQSPPAPDSDFRDADWLIRDMSVFVVPTVASLQALRDKPRRAKSDGNRFLGIGDPLIGVQTNGPIDYNCSDGPLETVYSAALENNFDGTVARGGSPDRGEILAMSALPETRCELATSARYFDDDSRLLLQADATEENLRKMSASGELASFRTLSFATHGLIAGEVGSHQAGLVMTPGVGSGPSGDGLLTTGEIAELKLDADIVLLSACNTAAGSADSDEGLSGLANAFFYAGARSLFVSHWPVYSDAAAEMTTSVLAKIDQQPGLGFAEALRLSMLEILDDPASDGRRRHPAYWAPFMVVGEGAGA